MQQDELQNLEQNNNNQTTKTMQDTNRIMGIVAIFISILSMIAVIYQSYLAREENELMRIQQSATVLPYLDHWYSNVGEEYKFVLENKGVGPAFIKEVQFIGIDLKSKDSLFFNSSNQLYAFLKQQSTFLDSIPAINSPVYTNTLLSPSEKREFFTFSFTNDNQKKRFRKEYYKYNAGYKIIYEDVYGTSWMLSSEKNHPVKLEKD